MRYVFAMLLFLHGCSTISEQHLYERMDKLAIAEESYWDRAHACREAGGYMVINRTTSSRIRRQLTRSEYDLAYCGRF